MQEDDQLGPSIELLDESSEHYKKQNEILVIGKATRQVSPGDPLQAVRGVTS